MNAYNPLYVHLSRKRDAHWPASFSEVEAVLGRALPNSARDHRAWWSNQTGAGHTQARAWREAGWRTRKVDLAGERVEFERVLLRDLPAVPDAHNDLLTEAGRVSGIDDRQALIREALTALIARENARHLIALGGTMPDFAAPPRHRPE